MRQVEKQCAFPGCTNRFIGPPQQKYCSDRLCIASRRTNAQKSKKQDQTAVNLSIQKGLFKDGTILRIRCAACGPSGRCPNEFIVCYSTNRLVYPKYCEQHRNAFKRAMFEGKIKNAKS